MAAQTKNRKRVAARTANKTTKRQRADGWQNPTAGHGTSRDRRTHTSFILDVITDTDARDLWRQEDLCARIIEVPPREALRRGFSIKSEDKETSEMISSHSEVLGIDAAIMKAGQFERAYGGAAIMPVMSGIGDHAQELDEGSIGKITALHLLEPRELHPASYYTDLSSPKFGLPKTYRLMPISGAGTGMTSQVIHESRLVIFPGSRVSRQLQPGQRPGWGDSVLTRPYGVLRDYGTAWGGAAHLLTDFGQGVLEMDGLAELSAQEGGAEVIEQRFATIDRARSTIRMMVIDGKDKFSRQTTPISGLDTMLVQFAQRVAAAADMPVTILMGMSPAGMNATGDADIRSWYDRIAALQEYYRPRIEQLLRLLMLSIDGPTEGIEPEMWSIDFNSLWAQSDKEKAETRQIVANTDAIYLDRQVVTPEDVANSRWKGDTFSGDMVIDWEARAKQRKANEKKLADIDAAALEAMRPEETAPVEGEPVEAVDGAKPAESAEAAPEAPVALNGAQIASLVEVVKAAINGEIPRESAIALIALSINVTPEIAESLLGPADFKPAVLEPVEAAPAVQAA